MLFKGLWWATLVQMLSMFCFCGCNPIGRIHIYISHVLSVKNTVHARCFNSYKYIFILFERQLGQWSNSSDNVQAPKNWGWLLATSWNYHLNSTVVMWRHRYFQPDLQKYPCYSLCLLAISSMILFGSTSLSQVREEQSTRMTSKQMSNSKPLRSFEKPEGFYYKFNFIKKIIQIND